MYFEGCQVSFDSIVGIVILDGGAADTACKAWSRALLFASCIDWPCGRL